jgi:hypothetical protein
MMDKSRGERSWLRRCGATARRPFAAPRCLRLRASQSFAPAVSLPTLWRWRGTGNTCLALQQGLDVAAQFARIILAAVG